MYRVTFIYSIFRQKSVSRLVVYKFIVFFLLHCCMPVFKYLGPVRHDVSFHCMYPHVAE